MGKPSVATQTDSGLDTAAGARARTAAQFIPAGARVLEVGGVTMHGLLPAGCLLQSRPHGALNERDAARADVVVLLDAIATADDGEAVLARLGGTKAAIVLNYRPRDLVDSADLADGDIGNGRLGFYDLARLFDRFGYGIECNVPLRDGEVLLRLSPTQLAGVAPCSVAVVSDAAPDTPGWQMLGTVLPPQATIHALTFDSLDDARERYDLVVIGTGNGLSPAMLSDALIDVARRGAAAVGIFGLQYRELMARAALDRLLGTLDIWFARNQDDLLSFGRDGPAIHLGDWTIDSIAMAEGAPFASVLACDLPSLVRALAGADVAAYRDASGFGGEARSLLLDIFGRGFPPDESFLVDRDAVARYKIKVRTNIGALRNRIEAILRRPAAQAAA
jgi:hypothetical protein